MKKLILFLMVIASLSVADVCYADSYCSQCKGSGKYQDYCPDCYHGYNNCRTCRGQGWVTCSRCDGSGKTQCSTCRGTGTNRDRTAYCGDCGGYGEKYCSRCQGRGAEECPNSSCYKGKIPCSRCDARGIIDKPCRTCNGTGIIRN